MCVFHLFQRLLLFSFPKVSVCALILLRSVFPFYLVSTFLIHLYCLQQNFSLYPLVKKISRMCTKHIYIYVAVFLQWVLRSISLQIARTQKIDIFDKICMIFIFINTNKSNIWRLWISDFMCVHMHVCMKNCDVWLQVKKQLQVLCSIEQKTEEETLKFTIIF